MAAVTDVNYALTPDQHARELRRAVVAATVGTTIEWYDFLLYSTMAGLVFGKLFFPNEDPLTATLSSFGIYFIGFLARPVGAFIFGHYGDRIGRKSTLIVTLILMGVSTFLVAFLPGYAVIGIWGAVLLTILRLIQGIGVGGEWGGSVLLSMEWARHNNERGFLASWPQFGGPAGLGLANLAVLIFSYWSGDQFLVWGWRIPFAFSIVLVGIGLWIRLRILETPVFRNLVNEKKIERAPIVEVCRKQWGTIILGALARTSEQGPFYIFTAFIFAYGTTVLHASRDLLLTGLIVRGVRVGVHHSVQRLAVRRDRAQEDVHHRRRHHGRVRLRLFRHDRHRLVGADLRRHGAVADPARHAIRPAGGADRGKFHAAAAL